MLHASHLKTISHYCLRQSTNHVSCNFSLALVLHFLANTRHVCIFPSQAVKTITQVWKTRYQADTTIYTVQRLLMVACVIKALCGVKYLITNQIQETAGVIYRSLISVLILPMIICHCRLATLVCSFILQYINS